MPDTLPGTSGVATSPQPVMTTADEALDDIPFAYPVVSFTTPIGRQPPTGHTHYTPLPLPPFWAHRLCDASIFNACLCQREQAALTLVAERLMSFGKLRFCQDGTLAFASACCENAFGASST